MAEFVAIFTACGWTPPQRNTPIPAASPPPINLFRGFNLSVEVVPCPSPRSGALPPSPSCGPRRPSWPGTPSSCPPSSSPRRPSSKASASPGPSPPLPPDSPKPQRGSHRNKDIGWGTHRIGKFGIGSNFFYTDQNYFLVLFCTSAPDCGFQTPRIKRPLPLTLFERLFQKHKVCRCAATFPVRSKTQA